MRCTIVMAAVSLIAGCGNANPTPSANGRVTGRVLSGPTCPVERPGDPNCQPKPVKGSVQFAQGDHLVDSVRIDADGAFAAEIPAGAYTVKVDTGANAFPECAPVDVEVDAGADAVVQITCDTGIR